MKLLSLGLSSLTLLTGVASTTLNTEFENLKMGVLNETRRTDCTISGYNLKDNDILLDDFFFDDLNQNGIIEKSEITFDFESYYKENKFFEDEEGNFKFVVPNYIKYGESDAINFLNGYFRKEEDKLKEVSFNLTMYNKMLRILNETKDYERVHYLENQDKLLYFYYYDLNKDNKVSLLDYDLNKDSFISEDEYEKTIRYYEDISENETYYETMESLNDIILISPSLEKFNEEDLPEAIKNNGITTPFLPKFEKHDDLCCATYSKKEAYKLVVNNNLTLSGHSEVYTFLEESVNDNVGINELRHKSYENYKKYHNITEETEGENVVEVNPEVKTNVVDKIIGMFRNILDAFKDSRFAEMLKELGAHITEFFSNLF